MAQHPELAYYQQLFTRCSRVMLAIHKLPVPVIARVLGMATAHASPATILLTGIAGLAAGALSMAAGEYVSVSSQVDAERADARLEAHALREHPEAELDELAEIYVRRGLDQALDGHARLPCLPPQAGGEGWSPAA